MTFALCYHDKRSGMATEILDLAPGSAIEVALDSGDIVRMMECDLTDDREFRNSTRVPGVTGGFWIRGAKTRKASLRGAEYKY